MSATGSKQAITKTVFPESSRNNSRLILLLVSLLPVCALSQAAVEQHASIFDISLKALTEIEITSALKKAGPLSSAPATVYVILASDIHRAGAVTLPEALRLAPNLLVSQVDASNYAISARGFNGTISNKLQVLIDGRSIYTPLFSGVFWDAQDVLLEDIDRIEVISGSAAALWGANAVNGVINIVTRNAAETQGAFIKVSASNNDYSLSARQGGKLGDVGVYRVYAKQMDRNSTERADGSSVPDSWQRRQAGFRMDWGTAAESINIQGDAYTAKLDQMGPQHREISGANLLLQWRKRLASGGNTKLLAYYDYTDRDHPGLFTEQLHSGHIEWQYSFPVMGSHQLQWGLDYRHISSSADMGFLPADQTLSWSAVYAQDEIDLPSNVTLTLSARAEHNDYTGMELMPAARLGWAVEENHLLWAAISRAVRTPSRIDRDAYLSQTAYKIAASPDFKSETALVYEAGYRGSKQAISWSMTVFQADYDHLRTLEPNGQELEFDNGLEVSSSGFEAWGKYQITDYWRLSAGLLALKQQRRLKSTSQDINQGRVEGNDPTHQWSLRSQFDFAGDKTIDLSIRRVGKLPELEVPAYTAIDLRLGWWLSPDLELSLGARNLLDKQHPEFAAVDGRSEMPRSFFAELWWML